MSITIVGIYIGAGADASYTGGMKNFTIRYGGEPEQTEQPTKHYWTEVGKKWRFINIRFLDDSEGVPIRLRVGSLAGV